MVSSGLTRKMLVDKCQITGTTDNVLIGNQTLTELLDNDKVVIGGEGFGNVLVTDPITKEVINYSNLLLTSNNEVISSSNFIPSINNTFSLGNLNNRWKEIYVGPGTINISGPLDTDALATLGSDENGVAYTQFGFASPFLNVGASELTPGVVGGWKISTTGEQSTPSYDLVAQEIDIGGGPSGPIYSLLSRGEQGATGATGATESRENGIPTSFTRQCCDTTCPTICSLTTEWNIQSTREKSSLRRRNAALLCHDGGCNKKRTESIGTGGGRR